MKNKEKKIREEERRENIIPDIVYRYQVYGNAKHIIGGLSNAYINAVA